MLPKNYNVKQADSSIEKMMANFIKSNATQKREPVYFEKDEFIALK